MTRQGWHPDVPVFGEVRYEELYPGVDLELSSSSGQWIWRVLVGGTGSADSDGSVPAPDTDAQGSVRDVR